jgi:hypothetical protein
MAWQLMRGLGVPLSSDVHVSSLASGGCIIGLGSVCLLGHSTPRRLYGIVHRARHHLALRVTPLKMYSWYVSFARRVLPA